MLRDHVGASYVEATRGTERLIRPLRPRRGFQPMPRHVVLRQLAKDWQTLRELGRLGLIAEFKDGTLRIAELRAKPVRMKFREGDDGEELALAVELHLLRISPPSFEERCTLLADIGLHALARRYERGADRSDAAVLADLAVLAHRHPAAVAAGGEIAIPAGGGRWIGSTTLVKDALTLAVRTFVA